MSGSLSLSPGSARSTLGSVVLPSSSADILLGRHGKLQYQRYPEYPRLEPHGTAGQSGRGCGADRSVALRGICVLRTSVPRREPCRAQNPWRCLRATRLEREGMERLQPWRGCFSFSALPCPWEHPRPGAPFGWKHRLGEPVTEEDGGCRARLEAGSAHASSWSPRRTQNPP